jgi:hypothetical protein
MYGYWRNVGRLVFVIGMVHRYVIQCKKKKKTKTKKSCISHSLPFPLFFHLTVFWFDFSSHVTRSVFLFKKAPKNLTKKTKKILSFFNFSLEFLFQFLSLSLFSFFLRLFELIRCFILSNSTSLFSVLHSTFYIQPRTVFFQSTEATPTSLPYCLPYLTGEEEKKINTHVHCQKFRRYFDYYCARHLQHRYKMINVNSNYYEKRLNFPRSRICTPSTVWVGQLSPGDAGLKKVICLACDSATRCHLPVSPFIFSKTLLAINNFGSG